MKIFANCCSLRKAPTKGLIDLKITKAFKGKTVEKSALVTRFFMLGIKYALSAKLNFAPVNIHSWKNFVMVFEPRKNSVGHIRIKDRKWLSEVRCKKEGN